MIQVGQVLDKYELLERVGQGGMAVVYRGLDRSLKRVVAVKVLHKHLSDYQEARDRFEREAQAVAKLRHENILEIFDYSGAQTAEALGSSYIVTEFIDGQTLRQVIADRPITFPELGALLVLQVCRALAHAHGAGILHRDVKPENIMIRTDGVVKLMDFGISHMVDLERLTVTGQLLGSPAYMAPEHVEGRRLDFRTDVFAVGIVLYQLTVGRLPFEGKNPHEVLKRIAECKFTDPRQANPRIGNRLGRIILRAMAAEPDDRYPSVGELVLALEGYLEESGVPYDKAAAAAELARYFEGPAAYEAALEDRLVDQLTRRGQSLLAADNRAGALDVFDRVLTIDGDNAKVIAILDGINRRTRLKAGGLAALFVCVMGLGAYMVHRRTEPPRIDTPNLVDHGSDPVAGPVTAVAREVEPPALDAGAVAPGTDGDDGTDGDNDGDAPDTRPAPATTTAAGGDPPGPARATEPPKKPTQFRVSPSVDAEYQLATDGSWRPVPDDGLVRLELGEAVEVQVRNASGCCQAETRQLQPGDDVLIATQLLPATIIARCADRAVSVTIDSQPWRLDQPRTIVFGASLDATRTAMVQFLGEAVDSTPIKATVKFKETKEVACVVR